MGKYKIAVVGLGGVGGYYGGKLAQRFARTYKYEIIFVARGAHKEAIEQYGLTLELGEEVQTIKPDSVVSDPKQMGQLDLILFCVKSYSLEQVAEQFAESINSYTLLLPLLNGIESIEYLQQRFRRRRRCGAACTLFQV
ncbi:2-dehydropantoate 2-reductase [uncultured Pontibacter sp.]|uniref:ketopantoate reductase family protein n=1 Tax=uncultured Pontibacter sp. TaxID=453356 RepID=UPI00260DA032|nr:2-dehydropantoate 2-reductase [uncultured Pontibacter sp.]